MQEAADNLKAALEVSIAHTRESLAARIGWGTGKLVLGVVEVGTGLVGIIVPVPGTTIAGVAVFALGANSVVDGFTQLAGANRGRGFNPLGEASGFIGSGVAGVVGANRDTGRQIGEGAFLLSSVALGAYGSLRILHLPGKAFVRLGVGGQPGGATLGRIDLLYASGEAGDGMTVLSINNNANKSILRFVTHSGRLVVNGRIFGISRVLTHASDPRVVLKGLLKLLVHGARTGW